VQPPRWMWMSPGSRPSNGTRPASTSTTPTRASSAPSAMSALLTSFRRSLEEAGLAGGRRRRLLAQVPVRLAGHAPTVRRPHDEADLEEIRLDHLGQRLRLVVDGGGDRFEADRPAAVMVDDRGEEAPVEPVETPHVHALAVEGPPRDRFGDDAVALHLRVVAHAPEETVGDARRAARAVRDLPGAVWRDLRVQDHRRAHHDPGKLALRVEIQVMEDPE